MLQSSPARRSSLPKKEKTANLKVECLGALNNNVIITSCPIKGKKCLREPEKGEQGTKANLRN